MDFDDDIPEGPSRSQVKREAEALQALGEELIALPEKQLAEVPLPEPLREAIELARRITSHGGLRRQRQYVGRLMRDLDPEPIRATLERLRGADRASKARFQEAEHWRERLLREGDAALTEFLACHPQADRQQLRQLMRAAAQEAAAGQSPRHCRELFRYLQNLA